MKLRILTALLIVAAPAYSQFGNATSIRSRPISTTAPSDGQALCFNSSTGQWTPAACTNAGPAGPTGPTGASGAAGATGPTGPAGSGAGTVTHTAGALTLDAVMAGNGSADSKVTGVTVNSSTNTISTPGGINTGVGGTVGGAVGLSQGTATTATSGYVGWMAPTSVTTPFYMTLPALPATGFLLNTGTTDPSIVSFVAGTGSGSVVRATSATLVTPALGTPSAIVLTNATGLPATAVPATPVPSPGTSITLTAPRGYAICTGTCTVSVPVPAAGYEFCIVNDDNVSSAITLSALGSSAMYENSARTAYGTAGTGTLVVSAAGANKVCIVGRDATHYLTLSYNGSVTVN